MLNESLETLQDYESKIASSKVDIAAAIVAKGGTVNTGDGLMDFAADIATIPTVPSSTVCAPIYSSDQFTSIIGYITIYNGFIVICGIFDLIDGTYKNYYINPSELLLSDYLSENENIVLYWNTSSTGLAALGVANNRVQTTCLTSGSNNKNRACYGTTTI